MQEHVLCEDSSDYHQEQLTAMSEVRMEEVGARSHFPSPQGFKWQHKDH